MSSAIVPAEEDLSGDSSATVPWTQPHSAHESQNDQGENQFRDPVILYRSISVNCQLSGSDVEQTGSLQIIERDVGSENDFWNIHVDFVWKPRVTAASKNSLGNPSVHTEGLNVSVDDLLTLRLRLETKLPSASIHLRGGKLLGDFRFPNGPDAAMEFWTALREHVHSLPLKDEFNPPQLFFLEKKPRMRRAVPSLVQIPTASVHDDENFSSLLQGLSIQEVDSPTPGRQRTRTADRNPRRRGMPKSEDFGMTLLSQFAKVTQAARDVGEEISILLDENKRREEAERKTRERAARRRALDIYADIVASTDVERELPPRLTLDDKRGVPVSEDAWRQSFDKLGCLKDPLVIKQAIFAGGVEDSLRSQVWPFILTFYSWTSSSSERNEILVKKTAEYKCLKEKWLSLQSAAATADEESLAKDVNAVTVDRRKRVSKPHADYLEVGEQILKDIVRTDRILDLYEQEDAPATIVMGTLLNVYAIYDNRITYCQGMSDFVSPIIHVMGVANEALAFWCFESVMRRIEGNFRIDQSGMRTQLAKLRKLVGLVDAEVAALFEQSDPDYYCCFRWILVRFKRELPFDATERIWEVLWTRHVGGDDFHIFITAALLVAHRRQLLSLPRAFDSLLRYINDMSMRIDPDFAIREGEMCFRKYGALLK